MMLSFAEIISESFKGELKGGFVGLAQSVGSLDVRFYVF